MKCPRCDNNKFQVLSTGQWRCSQCKLTRKFDKTPWQITKLSPYWKGRLLEFFCLGVPAYRLRLQAPLDRKTIQRWFRILRDAIYRHELEELSELSGHIEMDETMFDGKGPRKTWLGPSRKSYRLWHISKERQSSHVSNYKQRFQAINASHDSIYKAREPLLYR